ncbi:aldo/keto reductase [Streptomyces griseochromogenes]|uniref:aldo/keto reductase n=1 Tax=Streptomyces griseochromogenes TaxID=68214 RepID=UPI0037882096
MAQSTTHLAQHTLGGQGFKAEEIGLGTMGMTIAHGAPREQSGIATIRRAYELGVTLLDTAELYGLGTGSNEQLLGRAGKGLRDDILLATKFGYALSAPARIGGAAAGSRPERIREVTESNLRCLGADRIDNWASASCLLPAGPRPDRVPCRRAGHPHARGLRPHSADPAARGERLPPTRAGHADLAVINNAWLPGTALPSPGCRPAFPLVRTGRTCG